MNSKHNHDSGIAPESNAPGGDTHIIRVPFLRSAATRMASLYFLNLVALLVLLSLTIGRREAVSNLKGQIADSGQATREMGGLMAAINDAERAINSLLLTGDEEFRESYNIAMKKAVEAIHKFEEEQDVYSQYGTVGEEIPPLLKMELKLYDNISKSKTLNTIELANQFQAQSQTRSLVRSKIGRLWGLIQLRQQESLSDFYEETRSFNATAVWLLVLAVLLLGLSLALTRQYLSRQLGRVLRSIQGLGGREIPEPVVLGGNEFLVVERAVVALARSLNEAGQKEKALLEKLPALVFSIDTSGHFLQISRASKALTGQDPADLEGSSLAAIVPQEQLEQVQRFLSRLVRQGRVNDFSMELLHQDGRKVPVLISAKWSEVEGHGVGVAVDMTERVSAEERLNRLATIPEQNPHPMFELTRDGSMAFANTPAKVRFPEVERMGISHPLFKGLEPRLRLLMEQEEESLIREVELEERHYEQHVFLLRKLRLFRVYCYDITRLKENEARLRVARDEAQAANRAKSDFLSRMSHELRTPLNSIIGFAQLLRDRPVADIASKGKNLDRILQSSYHLLHLVNDVLDLSKVEAGEFQVQMMDVNVAEVLSEATGVVRPLAERHGVRVEIATAQIDCTARADRTRMLQVVLNLLTNAIKYNRNGGSVILSYTEDGDSVKVRVQDTGPGMTTDEQERIFLPFTRLQQNQGLEGSGIGLTLSQRLMELMGGSIALSSKRGEGSTFTCSFARGRHRYVPTVKVDPQQRQVPRLDPANDGPRTVLYVEDNAVNLELVSDILSLRPGIRLLSASNGTMGLELAQVYQPDLILLDIHLPDMNGFEVLEKLRSSDDTRPIPVIALTAQAMPQDVHKGLEMGFEQYITKPISVKSFLAIVDEILGLTRKRSLNP